MSVRISDVTRAAGTILRVDGRLAGDAIAELERAGRAAVPPLVLDLTGLSFADADGVRALRELRAGGVVLDHVPPFVALLLGGQPDAGAGR